MAIEIKNNCCGFIEVHHYENFPDTCVSYSIIRNFEDTSIVLKKELIDEDYPEDFYYRDYFVQKGREYSYSIKYYSDNSFETEISEDNSGNVIHDLDCVVLADKYSAYSLKAEITYGATSVANDVGVLFPIYREYPVFIKNSIPKYKNGSISFMVLGEYLETHILDRVDITSFSEQMIPFLTNNEPKIFKDSNGTCRMIFVSDEPSISYNPKYGNGIITMSFNWYEYCSDEDIDSVLYEIGVYDSYTDYKTLVDVSDTTATSSDVLFPKTFYNARGEKIVGSNVGYMSDIIVANITEDKNRSCVLFNGGSPVIDDYLKNKRSTHNIQICLIKCNPKIAKYGLLFAMASNYRIRGNEYGYSGFLNSYGTSVLYEPQIYNVLSGNEFDNSGIFISNDGSIFINMQNSNGVIYAGKYNILVSVTPK